MRSHIMLAILVAGAIVIGRLPAAAQSPAELERFAGIWKLDPARSTYSRGPAAKSNTTVLTVTDGGLLIVTDALRVDGVRSHTEVLAKFDGRDIPVKGSLPPITRAFKWLGNDAYEWVTQVNGKVTTTTRVQLSPDGRTQTLTTTGTDVQGVPVHNVTLFEAQ
jgi:hypothetical protein